MIDAHCHLQFEPFDTIDPFTFLEVGVKGAVVADYNSKRRHRLLELSESPSIWICAGIHPWALSTHPQRNEVEWEKLLLFVENHRDKIVAIGEFGVDYAMRHGADPSTQWYWFDKHLELALELDLPVVLHIVGAENDVADRLDTPRYAPLRVMCHGFSGTPEEGRRFKELGALISIGTDIVRGRRRTIEVCRQLGLDCLAVETDSPSRCPSSLLPPMQPSYLPYVVESVANALHLESLEVDEKTELNTSLFFHIEPPL